MSKIKCPSNLLYGQKSPILRHMQLLHFWTLIISLCLGMVY